MINMELWIRSQDKTDLVKVNEIFVNEAGTIFCNKMVFACYSKERALEVLDEIQETQLGNFHYRCPSNAKVSSKEDTIVYKMPEE